MKGKKAWLTSLILIVVVLLALFLRFYRLDGQSLWADEGNSAALAARNLAAITRNAAHDIHPPLYYYLLHYWVRFFGNSEIALRSLSALMGTALVFVTFLLGLELFNRRAALLASFLAAISPFQIYYSQETRMYVPAALWAALAVYFFLRWMRCRYPSSLTRPALGPIEGLEVGTMGATNVTGRHEPASFDLRPTGYAALYVLFTTAALYTHYFSFTIPLITNLAYGLGMIAHRPWRRASAVIGWALAQLAVVGLYYPWLRLAGGQLATWPAISGSFGLPLLLQNLLRVFSLGLSVEAATTPAVLVFGLLLLLGVLPWKLSFKSGQRAGLSLSLARRQLHPLIFTLLYLCLPVLAMYVLSLSRPAYDPKLLLLATPAFHLILARGMGGEWLGEAIGTSRRVGAITRWSVTGVTLLFVVGTSAQSLGNYYFGEEYARDDYRGLAQYIDAAGEDGDAIILNAPGQIDIFSYYYEGALPVYPLPGERPLDQGKTEAALEGIVAQHLRLYTLFWGVDESDPDRFIEGWLDRGTFKAVDSWHGNVRLAVYAVPQEDISSEIQHSRELSLGDEIAFLGYSLASSEVRAGDILQLTLFWQALDEIEERYKVFTHILDGRAHIVGQRDAEPVGGARSTTTWQDGEMIADNYGVLVLPGTPPGEHQLEIGMYNLETGERLSVLEEEEVVGDHILLEPIQVLKAEAPPLIATLGMQHRREVDLGPLSLLGYNLSQLGFEHQPEEPLHPGDILHLTLYWQAAGEMDTDFTLNLRLLDSGGVEMVSQHVRPVGGAYPPSTWKSGEIVRDQHNLLLPAELPSGGYDFFLKVHGSGAERVPLLLKSLLLTG